MLLLGACLLAPTPRVLAQTTETSPIHWAYAAFLGTGRYSLDDSQDIDALRFGVRRRIRPATLEDSGRTAGITLRLPLALSRHATDATTMPERAGVRSINTISVVPGVEFIVPITERWALKPLASLGYGRAFHGAGSAAWIYWLGIRSQLALPAERFDWALVNSVVVAGYSERSGGSERTVPWTTGLDFRKRLGARKIGGDPVFINWHIAHTTYLDEPVFGRFGGNDRLLDLDNEWEIGIAFSKGDKPLELKRLKWDRVGIAYRASSNSDFAGIRLNFRSLFDR